MKQKIKNFIHKYRYGLIMAGIGALIAIFDLTTKVVTEGQYITLIEGFISIFSSHNTGAAWSILNKHTWLLIILSSVFIGVLLIANYKIKRKNMLYAFGAGLIFSGAVCNLFDRIVFGYVRDFISLDFINFPIFNIADCAITIGVCLIILFFIILTVKDSKTKREIEIIGNQKHSNLKENNNETINVDDKIEKDIADNEMNEKFENNQEADKTNKDELASTDETNSKNINLGGNK